MNINLKNILTKLAILLPLIIVIIIAVLLIKSTILLSIFIIILFLAFVVFITNKKIRLYLKTIKLINEESACSEEALRISGKSFRTLFDYSSDEIFVSDLSGNFIELNQVACDSLDYTREELLKMKFFDIKTNKYKQFVKPNIKLIIEKGKHTYETEQVSKLGIVSQVEMKSRIIIYKGKDAIMSVSRNISERKKLEKEILSTIIKTEEKERKRFAADLHDDLGPILSTIKLYVDLVEKDDYKKTDKKEVLKDLIELVDLAITSTRDISNNITPGILHDFGLATAVNEFCGYINKTKSININFKTTDYKTIKKGIEETVLYQATKELINNTLKHASAQNITIELKSENNQIILYYRDDGIGFNVNPMLQSSPGLGLNNIMNKIKTIKGTCDFNSTPGKGMFLLIALKIEQDKQ